jgi:undecaprenyl diphosphate synthase
MALFTSSTQQVPAAVAVPRHVAIIMDGNGRWARKRYMPRFSGHARGVEMVRETVRSCLERGVEFLTLFAFSSENWRRPPEEVGLLMQLFVQALEQEVDKLDRNGVRLRIIGDLSRFEKGLQELIVAAEARTAGNTRLQLTIAANYGGRWDIMQAVNAMLRAQPGKQSGWSEADLESFLSMSFAPEPDLFIRTGGVGYRRCLRGRCCDDWRLCTRLNEINTLKTLENLGKIYRFICLLTLILAR